MEHFNFEGLEYLIQYPKGFDPERPHPTILLLHGAGTRGRDLKIVEKNAFFAVTAQHADFPFVVVAPQCSENTWFDLWERLEKLVLHVTSLPFVDSNRLYLMGPSMGGYATWQLAMSMPEYFAAIVPICGGGMYWNAGRLLEVPVWAFHGEKDTVVFPEESRKMVNRVNDWGGHARLTVYPENAHDAWSDTYANPEVFAWLLSHRRGGKAAELTDRFRDSKTYG